MKKPRNTEVRIAVTDGEVRNRRTIDALIQRLLALSTEDQALVGHIIDAIGKVPPVAPRRKGGAR